MPPRKRQSEAYDSDNGFVEDDDAPAPKRPKTIPSSSKAASAPLPSTAGEQGTDEDGNPFWTLNEKGNRRVTVNQFKGTWMVNVREMYEKDGRMMPGKKGISLTVEQYNALIDAMPAIDNTLSAKGQVVRRPDYEGGGDEKMEEVEGGGGEGQEEEDKEDVKRNFEATSEEED